MDVLEDWKAMSRGAIGLHKCLFIGCRGVQRLKLVELRRVVVSVQLFERAMLVTEHAALAIHALLTVVEGPAVLGLEESIVAADSRLRQFFLSVSKTAFIFVPALSCLDPVLAKLSFVLAIRVARHWHHLSVLHAIGERLEAHLLLIRVARLAVEAHRLLLARREILYVCWLECRSTWDERRCRCLDARDEFADCWFEWIHLSAKGVL